MNPYEVMDVDSSATDDEIKRAYKSKAQKLHPDKPGGDENKFKELKAAYEILSNSESRAYYDETGTSDTRYWNLNQLATIEIMKILDELLVRNDFANINYVSMLDQFFEDTHKIHLKNKSNIEKEIEKLNILVGTVENKHEENNLFMEVVTQRIAVKKELLESCAFTIILYETSSLILSKTQCYL